MQDTFALLNPQPSGWGFRFTKRIAIAMLTVLIAGIGPASAATTWTTMTFRVSVGGQSGEVRVCTALPVQVGANGKQVLDAAVGAGCINGYKTNAAGTYVTCIDPRVELCEIGGGLATFWAVYEDGAPSETGIGGFRAAPGKTLTFAYTNFLACPTYPDCPL